MRRRRSGVNTSEVDDAAAEWGEGDVEDEEDDEEELESDAHDLPADRGGVAESADGLLRAGVARRGGVQNSPAGLCLFGVARRGGVPNSDNVLHRSGVARLGGVPVRASGRAPRRGGVLNSPVAVVRRRGGVPDSAAGCVPRRGGVLNSGVVRVLRRGGVPISAFGFRRTGVPGAACCSANALSSALRQLSSTVCAFSSCLALARTTLFFNCRMSRCNACSVSGIRRYPLAILRFMVS
mmetsp:Transcript_143132/g.249592  ORF Transcript_143132/g.249592 Transcript_143132/m.249592 type:complete len:238 (+) Transcript_143132:703-1416(+)